MCGAIMWAVASFVPAASVSLPKGLRVIVAVALVAIGTVVGLLGVLAFRNARTTVNPFTPDAAALLVTTGVYGISRNPMYLGLLLVLSGWAVALANALNVAVLIGFLAYMNRFQIIPEERALATHFGEGFESYAKCVRRWL